MAGYRLWYDPKLTFVHLIAARRLNWDYVRKLGRSFGQTMAVLDLYRSELLTYRGWKRLKTETGSSALLWFVSQVLLFHYPYVRLRRLTRHSYDDSVPVFPGSVPATVVSVFRFPIKQRIARLAKSPSPVPRRQSLPVEVVVDEEEQEAVDHDVVMSAEAPPPEQWCSGIPR
ncbi:MAG: hypothetical protein R2751_16080 [Bacteroidales bacterium]